MRKNGFALAAAIIGTVALLCGTAYYYATLAASITAPSGSFFRMALDGYVLQALAAVALNWAAWLHSAKTPMLIASILYCPAVLFMFFSGLFFVLCVIFGFIAFSQLKKADVKLQDENTKD